MHKDKKELLIKVRQRFKVMLDADERNRRDAIDDFTFIQVPDGYENNTNKGQWDQNMLKERGKRPAYVFNKLRVTMARIRNDIRANTPSAKVRGVEGGDVETAEIFEGLIRNILNTSDFDTIIDGAANYMVSAGYGAWRVVSDYSTDTAFEQSIKVEEILNPFCLFSDPADKSAKKDKVRDWVYTTKMSKTAFESKYPKAEKTDFETHEFDDDEEWFDNEIDEVRIAEYWYKEPYQQEIWQLQDGKVIDADSDEASLIPKEFIKQTRIVNTDKIMMVVASGDAILEGPTEWAGSKFPFVVTYGEHFVVDGRVYWYGAGRWAKDSQRSYNVSRTAISETIAQAPQAKWWVTPTQAEGNTASWEEAHVKNFPFLQYNSDPAAPGPPPRMGAAEIPIALIQESQIASEEINMTTGRYQNDIGAPNAASSGKQEQIRNAQGDLATFNYPDNMGKAIQRTWELLIDLIPKVYDTERELRVLGRDGEEDYKTINTFATDPSTGEEVKINDLSVGTYDTTVTMGASYSTKRQEFVEMMNGIVGNNPETMALYGDLFFKAMDMPFSDEMAKRAEAMLPPQIQQLMQEGKDVPPEVMQMMQQANQAMKMVEMQMQEVQEAGSKVQLEATENDQAKAEIEKLIAQLETKQSQFEAKVAQQLARVEQKDAQVTIKQVEQDRTGIVETSRQAAEQNSAAFNESLVSDVAQSMEAIGELVQQFNVHAVEVMKEIQEKTDEKPKIVKVTSQRVNGKLEAVPVYESVDETKH